MIKIKNVKFRNKLLEEVKGLEPVFTDKYSVSLFGIGMDAYGTMVNASNMIRNNKGTLRLTEVLYLIDNNLYLLDEKSNEYYTFGERLLENRLNYIVDFFKTESILSQAIVSFIDQKMVERLRDMNIPDNIREKFYEDKRNLFINFIKYTGNVTIRRLSRGDMPSIPVLVGDVVDEIVQNAVEKSDIMTDIRYADFYQELLSGIYDYVKFHIICMINKLYITADPRQKYKNGNNGYKQYKDFLLSNFTDYGILNALYDIIQTTDDGLYEMAKRDTPDHNKAFTLLKNCVNMLNDKSFTQNEESIREQIKYFHSVVNYEMDTVDDFMLFERKIFALTTMLTPYNRMNNIDTTVCLRQEEYDYNTDCNKFILENNADIFCIFDNHKWTNIQEMTERLTLTDYRKYNTNLIKSFKTIGFCCPFMASLSQFDVISIKNENFKLVLLDPEIDEDENLFNEFMMDQQDDFDSKEEFEGVYNAVYNRFYYDDEKYGIVYHDNTPIVLLNLDNREYSVESGVISCNKHLFNKNDKLTPFEKRQILIQNGIYPRYYSNSSTEYIILQDIDKMFITRQAMAYVFELLKYLEEKQTDSGIDIKMVELELTKGRKSKHKTVTFEITERKSSWVRAHYRHYKSGIVTLVTAHYRKGCHVNTSNEKLIINL